MNTKKMIAMVVSAMMIGSVATACGDNNKENKTPHTTYSADQINNMSDDELEKALENAANEIEMSEKAEKEAPAEDEAEGIDLWEDVQVTFSGAEGFFIVDVEYVGDNQIIKDNVELSTSIVQGEGNHNIYKDWYPTANHNEWVVSAWYDEAALKEQGIVLNKNKNTLEGEYSKWANVKTTDLKFYDIPELGHKVNITDDTDTTPFAAAVEAITEKVKEEAYIGYYGTTIYEWAKDNEIYPTEFYLVKEVTSISTGEGYISYSDKDGNFLSWVHVTDLNYFHKDGTWCKDEWMLYSGLRSCYETLTINPEVLIKVEIN